MSPPEPPTCPPERVTIVMGLSDVHGRRHHEILGVYLNHDRAHAYAAQVLKRDPPGYWLEVRARSFHVADYDD